MKFSAYQERAKSTKVYSETHQLIYPVLGLCGETGELANKLKKVLRDHAGALTYETKKALLDELGDCLWYLAMIAEDLNVNLEDVAIKNLEKLADRKDRDKIRGEGDKR